MIYDAKYRAQPKQAYLPCATNVNVDHEQRVQQLHSTLPPLGLQSEVITVIDSFIKIYQSDCSASI